MTSHQYRMKGSLSYSLTITHNALYRSIKPEERLSKGNPTVPPENQGM